MKENRDPWFIRLPDGRVIKAKTTAAVQHHIEAGHIPLNSFARRDPSEEWQALAWIQEFSERPAPHERTPKSVHDLVAPQQTGNGSSADINLRSGVSARLDPMKLQTVGVRGYMEELIAALDSTVHAGKLLIACCTGATMALLMLLIPWMMAQIWAEGIWLGWMIAAAASAVVLAFGVALLSRQTHQELSSMKPGSWREARQGMQPFFFRLAILYLIVGGVGYGLIWLFGQAPGWLGKAGLSGGVYDAIATIVGIVGLLLAIGIFIAYMLAWLIAPILVVEEGSVADAFREWRALCREHRLRIFLYEGFSIAVGLVAMLPLAIPVYLATTAGPPMQPNVVSLSLLNALWGFAAGPLIAFLAVSNVFVYLNLRYEYTPAK